MKKSSDDTPEIKPCPFCGCGAELMTDEFNFASCAGTVMCMKCFACGPGEENWKDAVKAWNRRAS